MHSRQEALIARLGTLLDPAHVLTDEAARRLHSQDVYRSGMLPIAIVRPGSTEEVAGVVAGCTAEGIAVFVRGGGMSYTDAFLPTRADSIVLDLARMKRAREIHAEDLHATVEAGCTWQEVDSALATHGLRSVF